MTDAARLARLATLPLTYSEVGASLTADLPAGYQHLRRSRQLGGDFESAKQAIWDWQIQRRAGLSIRTSGPAELDAVIEIRMKVGPAAVTAPCRVVAMVDEVERAGFAYGTLSGHPESGEEAFLVEQRGDELWLTITAFSRPATLLSRIGAPVARRIQDRITERYLRALG
jgi:uncharacterized protein (UPF0548 family)